MSLGATVSALVALAKALPVLSRLADQFTEAWRAHRHAATVHRIHEAVAAAQAAPWVCPPRCPHRVLLDGLHTDPLARPQPSGPAPGSP